MHRRGLIEDERGESATMRVESIRGGAQLLDESIRFLEHRSPFKKIGEHGENAGAVRSPGERTAARLFVVAEDDDRGRVVPSRERAGDPRVKRGTILVEQDEVSFARERFVRHFGDAKLRAVREKRRPRRRRPPPILPRRHQRDDIALPHGRSSSLSGSPRSSRIERCNR